jgi:hypothetical protein
MVKMIPVPEDLLRGYATGMVNHKYMKSRILNILEEHDSQTHAPTQTEDGELTPEQKIDVIATAYARREFALKEGFEEDFILAKKGITDLTLTQKQINRLDEIWRKYKRTLPEL